MRWAASSSSLLLLACHSEPAHDSSPTATGTATASDSLLSCEAPYRFVDRPTDCDDADPEVHEGAQETCEGRDQDCDDTNPLIAPDQPEDCDNHIDDNCNGLVDGHEESC